MAKRVNFHTGQTDKQWGYLAGIIDGEGCFYIGKTKNKSGYGSDNSWHCMIKVTSCDEVLIEWLEKTFGGAKEKRSRWTSKKTFCRPVYTWQATGAMLDYIIFQLYFIHDLLVIKKTQCEIMGQYRNTCDNIGSKRLSDHVIETREKLMTELRKLNSRWHNHPLKTKNFGPVAQE